MSKSILDETIADFLRNVKDKILDILNQTKTIGDINIDTKRIEFWFDHSIKTIEDDNKEMNKYKFNEIKMEQLEAFVTNIYQDLWNNDGAETTTLIKQHIVSAETDKWISSVVQIGETNSITYNGDDEDITIVSGCRQGTTQTSATEDANQTLFNKFEEFIFEGCNVVDETLVQEPSNSFKKDKVSLSLYCTVKTSKIIFGFKISVQAFLLVQGFTCISY